MSKVSIARAAKLFAVSRPTLLDHLKKGKISGEKAGDKWQIDMAELKRVYQPRSDNNDNPRHGDLSQPGTTPAPDLQAEIKALQAQLEAEKQARELVERHLDDLRRLLPGPQDRPARRRWWPFGRG